MAIIVTEPFTGDTFEHLALAEFPELAGDFESVRGMPTLRASIFAQRLQRAKGSADWDSYRRGIGLLGRLWENPDAELRYAISWVAMRGLDFEGPRGPVAWECLSPDMRRAWKQAQKEIASLQTLPRKTKKPKPRRRR